MTPASQARGPLRALVLIAVVPLVFHITILLTRHTPLALTTGGMFKGGLVTLAALMHWVLYSSLLTSFALTLRAGRVPLITRFAYRIHGPDLSDEMIVYTRHVTQAWCLFFGAQLLTSIGLFCLAPITVWSVFANLFDIPLVVAMFIAEHAVRVRVLAHPPRYSFATMFGMVSDCVRDSSLSSHMD